MGDVNHRLVVYFNVNTTGNSDPAGSRYPAGSQDPAGSRTPANRSVYVHTNLSTFTGNMFEDLQDFMFYQHQDPFIIFLIVLYALAFTIGFLGNLFVILVVLRHRHMRTLTNVFFLNLTIGDFMVNCICIPITLGNYVYRDWIYGEVLCKVSPFLQITAVGVSVLSMLSISINRYFAIHIPLRAKILFSRTRVHVMLASIWVISFSVSSPVLFVRTVLSHDVPEVYSLRVCYEAWSHVMLKHAYNMIVFLLLFLFPLAMMSALYLKISLALWSKNIELFDTVRKQTFMSPQVDRLLLQRRKTVRTLVLLVVLFAGSWLPYYVVNAWLDFNPTSTYASVVSLVIYPLVQLVGLSNSSINPILYCFLSNGFRRAFTNMCCWRAKRTRHGMVMTVRYRCSDDSGVGSVETVLS
ncbi:QRFP-like peptide receptor [Physella acuta]|uniref:QRFP-like peptide receptor n=1 Tax=Physella acuta TaxID=109671 RepID=UPI0027DDEF39|nr:QRFP-like peptide receptor [Physella acuta]